MFRSRINLARDLGLQEGVHLHRRGRARNCALRLQYLAHLLRTKDPVGVGVDLLHDVGQVPAGAKSAVRVSAENPGKPASLSVGACGHDGMRLSVLTPSGVALLDLIEARRAGPGSAPPVSPTTVTQRCGDRCALRGKSYSARLAMLRNDVGNDRTVSARYVVNSDSSFRRRFMTTGVVTPSSLKGR
jgi:hypothetical protein